MAINENLNTGSCGSFTTLGESPVSDSNNQSSKVWDQEMSNDDVFRYREILRNSEPEILSSVSTPERKVKIDPKIKDVIVDFMVYLCHSDVYVQRVFRNFKSELSMFITTRRGLWYRVCFLYACDKIKFCSVRPNLVEMISFLSESSVERFLVPILINSVFKAIIEDLPFQKLATEINVKRLSFTYVISKLMFLRDFRPTVFDQVLSTSPYGIQVLSFTIQSKVFAEIIEKTLLKYLNRQNSTVRREIWHQTRFEDLRPFFYHVEREGLICIDPSISLGKVMTVAGASSLMTHLVGWTAQGLSDILPGYQTSNKLCETLDSIKDTMNTATDLMEDVKDTIPPIKEFTDSAKSLIPKVEDTTNKVNSIFDRLSEILEPILNVVNGIKDFGKNVVDTVRVLWRFLLEYQQIAFPIVLGILIYIVKDHMGKVVAHTFIAAVVIIAFAYYGAKISEELKRMLLSYFGYNTSFQNQNYDDYVSLAAAMYCVSGVDLKHKSQVIQALKAIPPVAKGAEVVMNALLGFFMKMGLLVSAYLGVEPKFANLVDANLGPWLTTTMNYMSRQKAMGLDTTDLGADNLRAHIDRGIDLAAQFELLNKKSISMTISQNVRNLQQIHAELTALRDTGPKERAEPVCILLTGEPGNGKSTVAKILADALVKIDFKGYPDLLESYQRNPQKYIHQRSTEKWFESYDPDTKVLIRDEFPATKETTPDDSPFVQLLDEIGVNSKPLPMANAEQKGKLHYNHAYSILTSNATKFDSEMLLNPNAIARRLHIVVNVSSRGVTNHLRGDALDPSGWKFHLMELEGTNSVKYKMTTVEITLIQLVHLAAGIRALRQHVLRQNKKISSQFTDKVCEITDNKLYHIVAKSFKMLHGRMPDNTEFMNMLKELGDDLKELTPNPETAEAILNDITNHPYHNQVDIDDDQLIVGEYEVTHFPKPIVSEPNDTVPNIRLEDYVEALRDQAGRTRSNSPPPSYANSDRPGTPIDENLNRPIPFYGVTIDFLVSRLQVLYGQILETAGTPVEFSFTHQFEYNDPSKKNFHEIKIGSRAICGLSFNTPFGYLQQRIEWMLALAMTYGKVKIFDLPMPWLQAEVTMFTASKTSEGDIITSTTITDKANGLARILSTFLHTIGIKKLFSYNVDVLTTAYYNDVWIVYPRLKKLIPVIKDCFVKWTKNEMTAAEARRKIWHTVYPMIPTSFVIACEDLKEVIVQQTNKLHVALKGAVKWVKEHWKELLGCLGVVSTIVGMFYMHNGTEEEPDSFLDVFHNQDSSMRADKYVARTRNQNQKRNQVIFKTGEFRSQADIHYIENYSNTLVENMWYFKSRTEKNAGVVLFIERKRAILPGHFYKCALDWYNDDPSQPFIVLEKGSQRFEFSRDEVHVVADFMKDDVDLVILDFLKPQFPFQRNIKNYFVSPKDEGVSLNKSVFRMDLFTPKRIVTDDGVNVEHMVVESSDAHLATEIIVDNSRRRNVISYPIPTLKGECGSVVVHNGKIIGIHIAGNNTWGAAARINSLVLEGSYLLPEVETAEDFSLFTKFEYDKTGLSHSQLYDELVHKGYWSAYCIPGMNPHVRDQLVEWNPKDELKPTVFPADTSVSNYPVAKSKFGPVPKNVDMAIWNACVDAYGNHIMSTVKPSTYKEVLSVEEAFSGVSNTSIKGLDHQTSPGWPYNYLKIDRRRIAYVDESGKLVKGDMYADFVKDMQFQVRMCCHDYTPSWVFTETLKSETRAPEKVKSPRLIAGAPLSHTVISKMHFGAFYAHLADNHYLLPTLIGFDPHQDWDYYQRRMNSISDGIRESYGDFKGFDCAREVFEMEFVARLANRFYGDDDDSPVGRVRHQLIKGSIVCLHLFHKIFVLEDVGWSSGSYHTAAGNSLFNDLLHMYCAAMEAKEKGMDYVSVINKYFDNVYLKTLGDDCAMGVTKEFSFHNNASMAPILLRDFGMIYTDVKKSPNVKPWDDIEDRLLLKRSASYIVDDGKFYGKLELSTILNTVCYTRIGNEIPVMRQRVDNAIRELSFHPKETWDKYLPIILKKAGPLYVWKNYSWKQLRHMALNDWFNQVSEPTSEVVKLIVQDLADNKKVHWGDLQVLPFTSSSRVIDLTEPSGCNTLDGVSENIKAEMNTDTSISHISCAGYLPGFQYQEPSLRYRVGAHARVGDFNQQDCYSSYSSTHNQMDAVGSNEIAPTQVEGVSVMRQTSDSSQNVTTHFADDTIGYESSNLAVVSTSDRLVYELTAKSSQSIIDFLQRPAVMTNGNFTTADTGILWSADLSTVFTSIKIAKMNNIYTFKSDFQITLQVNADRFQQGRYMLCFLPYGGVNNHVTDSTQIPAWRRMHTCNLTKITQLPHVEIDLSTQTHVTLNIPFTSAFPMFSWSTTGAAMQQSNGLIFIIPYSPLATGTGGSTTCGYTVLGSLSNIKIGAASHAQADVGTNEAKAMGVGPVSGVLNRVSKATNVLGQLPVIGSLAANVSWFTRVLASSAAIMGFSKPMVVSAPTRMVRQVAIYNSVSDIAHTAKPLGMIAENSVAIPDNIPKNVDEMSFDFIKKVPAFVSEFSWNTSAVAGTLLFSESVSPRGSTGWSKGFAHAPVSFINLNFARWRGGIEYNFKLVKTQFHRGRLMVAFFPGTTNGQNYANSETVFREIVDVSSTGAFKVCCPYMIPIPWSLSTASIGQIAVYVLDSLECPAAVSSTVRVLVEKSGADDLQWAVPIGVNYYEPYSPSTAQMAESYTETPCFTLGPAVPKPNDELTQYTTGEPIKSVRQLIKRIYTFSSGYVNIGATQIVQYYPYAIWPVTQAATTSGALQRDFSFSDFINLWACAYVFNYGSMRLFARPASGANQVVEASAINGLSTSRALYTGTGYDGSGVKSYTPLSIEGVVEVQAPNWNSTLARPTLSHFTNPVGGISMVEPNANCTNILLGDSIAGAAYQINLGRAAAEDYGFGMFIGVPPIVPIGST